MSWATIIQLAITGVITSIQQGYKLWQLWRANGEPTEADWQELLKLGEKTEADYVTEAESAKPPIIGPQ